MKIKITIENKAAIEAALKAVNGRAESHAYTTWGELAGLATDAETRLAALLAKKDWQGARLTATSGDKVPSAYKYSRSATHVEIERGASAWFLTYVSAGRIYASGGGAHLTLTAAQDAEAVTRLRARYHIARPKPSVAIAA
ncbi:MAG: hypothetical protein WCL05_01510 [Verrucomicrobiota bacterium]